MKISCFDFDATLVFTPSAEEGKIKWYEKTGKPWPHNGWWGQPDSLNIDVFNIPLNQWVYEKYLEERKLCDYVFLATGRITKLQKQVLDIIKSHNIEFDDVYCNPNIDTIDFKRSLFDDILKKNPKVEEFTMYDDREEHFSRFIEWAKQKDIKVNIIDVINKIQIF